MIQRYAEYKGYDVSASVDLSGYSDVEQIAAWARPCMEWANAVGLITGKANNRLAPRSNTTRAETAMILLRFCETIIAAG